LGTMHQRTTISDLNFELELQGTTPIKLHSPRGPSFLKDWVRTFQTTVLQIRSGSAICRPWQPMAMHTLDFKFTEPVGSVGAFGSVLMIPCAAVLCW
jgi:hypothetical protein